MPDPAFAAGVDREQVRKGAKLLGIELDGRIRNVIDTMREAAPKLGLVA